MNIFDDAVFAASRLERDDLAIERELKDLKWYGYRFMTPLEATKLFYDTYRQAEVAYMREHKDYEYAATLKRPSFVVYIKKPGNLVAVWRARQRADTFCAPYDAYMEFCMRFWSRRSGGGRSKTPRLNQMGYKGTTEVAWRAEFQKFYADRLTLFICSLVNAPELHPDAYQGTDAQRATRAFILQTCKEAARPWPGLIETWCYSYPLLTPECFLGVLSKDELADAIAIVEMMGCTVSGGPSLATTEPKAPTCIGMPGALDALHDACSACSHQKACAELSTSVIAEVRRVTGHENPRGEEQRLATNARKAKSRAKKKAAIAGRTAGTPAYATGTSAFTGSSL